MENVERYLTDPSSKLAGLQKLGVMVYMGETDEVVSRDAINKVIAFTPGSKLIASSPKLGHTLLNHKLERDIVANEVKAWFD